jgi:pimeloyl-ACP methyl ester carboxylesterase
MNSLKLRMTFIIVVLLILYSSFQWYKTYENIVLSNGTRLEWTSCWFKVPLSQITKRVSCAYLFPSSLIRLPIVVIKQPFWNRQPSPILYLIGGPGYATGLAQEEIEYWLTWLDMSEWPHDLVLFDQRGIGMSQPQANCPEIISIAPEVLGKSLTLEEEFSLEKVALEQCYKRLRESGINLSSYTTLNSSHDVGDLMEALGGTDWNLYGVSYGTRLALSVVREYPERVRSVILDSVYPPEIRELLETPFVYDNALAMLFKGCAADEDCNSAFPNLEASFFTLLAQLRQTPLELMVLAPGSEKKLKVVINDNRLVNMVFQAIYRWDFIGRLPFAIESARRGDYEPLMPIVEYFVAWLFDTNFSDAVYMSVECYDSFPEITRDEFMAQVARFPRVRYFVEKQWDYNFCRIWQVGRANDAFRQPVNSNKPALFLAGEYDPITPPIWAKNAAAHFSQGHVFVFPGIGHGAVNSDTCAPQLVRKFLQNPKQKPQHECFSWLSVPNFILDAKEL